MPTQTVEYPFSAGLDEGTDPRRTPKFIAAENYVWTKRGRLEKRNGFTTLPTTISGVDAASRIVSVAVTAGGSGYTGPFLVAASGGGGAGFAGIATVTAGAVTAVAVVVGGWGFTASPTFDFSVGGGTGATAVGTLSAPGTPPVLSTSQTLRATPQGALQLADGANIYNFDGTDWCLVGQVPNVGVTTAPTPLKVQVPDLVHQAINPFDWYVVACAGRYVWWPAMAGPLVVDIESTSIIPTNNGVHLSGGGSTAHGTVVTDGERWTWKFNGSTYAVLDMLASTPPHEVAPAAFPGNGVTIGYTFFDAVWDGARSRLVTAYVLTGDTHITVRDWTWNAAFLSWDAGVLNQTFTISTTAFSMNALAVNVCSDGKAMVAWGYYETAGTLLTWVRTWVESLHFAQPFSVDEANYSGAIVNLSIAETNAGADYHVAFTSQDWAQLDPVSGVFTSVGVLSDCVHSYRITRDVAGVVVNGTFTSGTTLATRLFVQDGAPYALAYAGASISYEVLDLSGIDPPDAVEAPGRVVAYINPRIAFQGTGSVTDLTRTLRGSATLATAVAVSANEWMVPTTVAPEPGESGIMQLQECYLDFAHMMTSPVQEWTGLVYPTSVPSVTSTVARAVQFLSPPVIMAATTSPGAGHLSAGNYAWIATYSRIADDGSIVESPPSTPFTVLGVTANDAIALSVLTYGLGGANANEDISVSINMYRTQVNQGNAFYRTARDPYTTFESDTNRSQFVNIAADGGPSDASIAANPQIYTAGGVFDNVCPPACTMAARVRDRVYLAGTPDGFTVYYSDPVLSAGFANFHDEQTITTDDDGPVTAIAGLDDKTIIFKMNAIYVVYGSEGSNTGNGNTLSKPTDIPSGGVGCVSQSSIVTTPRGLMFQSTRGIELLDRGLNVSFIGEPVKDATEGKFVASAMLVPDQYQVRFYLSDWSTMVMSTLNGEWTTFQYANRPTTTFTDAVNVNGQVYWCGAGHVMKETPGVYSDNGSNIGAFWQSGWITLGQLEGYRRYSTVQLLGQWFAETSIQTFILTDYRNDHIQTSTWTGDQIATLPEFDANRVQLQMSAAIQKAEAISVALLDEGPSDGAHTRGIGWEAISFEVVQKPGRYRKLSSEASR